MRPKTPADLSDLNIQLELKWKWHGGHYLFTLINGEFDFQEFRAGKAQTISGPAKATGIGPLKLYPHQTEYQDLMLAQEMILVALSSCGVAARWE